MNEIRNCWANYCKFRGRSGIMEFWKWCLLILGILLICAGTLAVLFSIWGNQIPPNHAYEKVCHIILTAMMLFCLATFTPTIAVMVRRLRDAGICPWWLFVPAVLCVITTLMFFDAALAGMSEMQPSTSIVIRTVTYTVTALTVFAFICLFCKSSKQ